MKRSYQILAAIYLCSITSITHAQSQDPFLWLEEVRKSPRLGQITKSRNTSSTRW